MDNAKPRIEPLDVLKWGGVALGLYGLADALGIIEETRDPYSSLPPPVDTVPPTITLPHARLIADRVFSAIYGDGSFWTGRTTEDERAVIDALTAEIRNDGDVYLVVDAYGLREGSWSLAGLLDLPATVREYLDPEDVAEINDKWTAKGITLRL